MLLALAVVVEAVQGECPEARGQRRPRCELDAECVVDAEFADPLAVALLQDEVGLSRELRRQLLLGESRLRFSVCALSHGVCPFRHIVAWFNGRVSGTRGQIRG